MRWMMGCSLTDRHVSYHGGSELKCVACSRSRPRSEPPRVNRKGLDAHHDV
jgi:hypothetical protein